MKSDSPTMIIESLIKVKSALKDLTIKIIPCVMHRSPRVKENIRNKTKLL
jgi:hypothetical protein